MKILLVIHGYPMRYNAGSEVYTQTLAERLARDHDVAVFTREEDPFAPDFRLRVEPGESGAGVTRFLVNNPRHRDRYREPEIDRRFGEVLDDLGPDVVHVGHLNHLSTSLLPEAKRRAIPIVFTLHDFWLMCPRGQFMQMYPGPGEDLWPVCDGQEDRKCATRCYARYFSGAPDELGAEEAAWESWVARRMAHVREMVGLVDRFVAPSRYLLDRHRTEFDVPEERLVHLDYGFDRARLAGRRRRPGEPFTFGYIGTHIPAKGIHHLLEAFGRLEGETRLRIWGRPRGQETAALRALAAALPNGRGADVEWLPEYRNQDIVREVFDRVDAIVVPSIWTENSPLVIHEAQQARVPVITADAGGMAEYVRHEVNGLLFAFRDPADLTRQMARMVESPETAAELGRRGYLYSERGDIPEIGEHADRLVELYREVRAGGGLDEGPAPKTLWRLTLDTNPDTCNLRCVMCEEHSPFSPKQGARKRAGRPRREMPVELLRRVVDEACALGLREIIPSTMGEPLLYEHFDEIVRLCRQRGLSMNLTTNGTFPGRGAAAWAEAIVPVGSDVKISINGATKATQEAIMIGCRWEEVLDNARAFLRVRDAHEREVGHRCRVTFQVTFLEDNLDELLDLIDLAIDLGVDRLKGHHLWAHFPEIEAQSMRRDAAAIARWNRFVAAAQARAARRTPPNGRRIVLENIFPLSPEDPEDLAPGGACPFLGREAWVSAAGVFAPCCAPDDQRRTLGDFGNLHDRSLRSIWEGSEYRRLTEDYAGRSLCRGCNMRQPLEVGA